MDFRFSRSLYVSLIITVFCLLCITSVAFSADARSQRSYVSGNYFLTLDNTQCGFVKAFDGGNIGAEVINEPSGPSYYIKKHIGQPKYEDITTLIGFSMNKTVYEWIQDSWSMKHTRHSGSIVSMDYNLDAKSERQFTEALLTETTIPACDGSSKEPSYISITFAPELIRTADPKAVDTKSISKNDQKIWIPSNFKLAIDGLDCNKVSKIDSFTIKQMAVNDAIGDARDYQKEPGKLEFPNLRITISEVSAKSWIDWHNDFVIQGNNDESKEKNGTLTFLAPNLKDVLATITFYNLGIFNIASDKSEANSDQIKRITAELYCERMEFRLGGGITSKPGRNARLSQ